MAELDPAAAYQRYPADAAYHCATAPATYDNVDGTHDGLPQQHYDAVDVIEASYLQPEQAYDPYYYPPVPPAASEPEEPVYAVFAMPQPMRIHPPPIDATPAQLPPRRGRRVSYVADLSPEYSPPRKKAKAKSRAVAKAKPKAKPPMRKPSNHAVAIASASTSRATSRSTATPFESDSVHVIHAGPGPTIDTADGPFAILNSQPYLLAPPEGSTLDGSDLLIIDAPGTHGSRFEVYTCRACYKAYDGRNARSVARRHLQDKHGVKLEWQKRRTRWESVNPVKPADEIKAAQLRMRASKREYAQRTRTQSRIEREHASYLESFGPGGLMTFAGVVLVAPRYKAQHPDCGGGGFLDGHAGGIILPSDLRSDIAALRQLVRAEHRGARSESPLPVLREEMGSDLDGEGEEDPVFVQGSAALEIASSSQLSLLPSTDSQQLLPFDQPRFVHQLQPAVELLPSRTVRRATVSGVPSRRPTDDWSSPADRKCNSSLSDGWSSSDAEIEPSDSSDQATDAPQLTLTAPTRQVLHVDAQQMLGFAPQSQASQKWLFTPFEFLQAQSLACTASPSPEHVAESAHSSAAPPPEDDVLAAEVAEQLLEFASSPIKPEPLATARASSSASHLRLPRSSPPPAWAAAYRSDAAPTPTTSAARTPVRSVRHPFVAHRPDAPHRSLSALSLFADDPFLTSPAPPPSTARKRAYTTAGPGLADLASSPVRAPLGSLRTNAKTPVAHAGKSAATARRVALDTPDNRGAGARWQLSSPGGEFAATLGLAPHALPTTPGLGDIFSHGTPVPRGRG